MLFLVMNLFLFHDCYRKHFVAGRVTMTGRCQVWPASHTEVCQRRPPGTSTLSIPTLQSGCAVCMDLGT